MVLWKKTGSALLQEQDAACMIMVVASRIPTGYIAIAQANYMRTRNIQAVAIDVVSEG